MKVRVTYDSIAPPWQNYSLSEINAMVKEAQQNVVLQTRLYATYLDKRAWLGYADKLEVMSVVAQSEIKYSLIQDEKYWYLQFDRDLKPQESVLVLYKDKSDIKLAKDEPEWLEVTYVEYVMNKILSGFPDKDIAKKILKKEKEKNG